MAGVPDDAYAFDPDIAVQAAENFKSRKKQRDAKVKAADEGQYTKAESPKRLALRVNRLLDAVKGAVPVKAEVRSEAAMVETKVLPGAMHELVQQPAVTAEDVNDALVERVIGATRDFLAVGFFERGALASRAVCRIVTNLGGGRRGLGTGFLVTPSLLMTNHHVLKTSGAATNSTAEFNYQLSGTGATLPVERFALRPDVFFLNDRDLDFALVAVDPRSANGTPLDTFGYSPLIGAEGKIIIRDPVNIVQHPKGDLKQIVIRQNTLLDLPEPPLDKFAHYEADTEQGSSGSPVFNDQWEVVALHHSGVPRTNAAKQILDRKGNVWPPDGDPDDIDWISNEGIRTSRLVNFIKAATVREHEKRLQQEFIAVSSGIVPPPVRRDPNPAIRPEQKMSEVKSEPAVRPPQPRIDPPRPHEEISAQRGTVTLTVPLTITIGLGMPQGGTTAVVPAAISAPALSDSGGTFEAAINPDPDYENRPGYDPDFLGFPAPLPTLLPAARALAIEVGDGIELKYHHYSVIMNAQRRLAFVSAVNLDAGAEFQLHREAADRWFFDPRIERKEQIGGTLYASNPLDRGHLTRRADAAWGHSEEEAQRANDDTFHWTNCSPQHEVFNQSSKANARGLLLWGTLENHVAEQAGQGTRKLSVFNGPVFRSNDRIHREVKIPREFYKLIVYARDNGRPGAVAFILSQQSLIRNLPAEEFEVGPYRPFQVKVTDLQKRTNLNFGTMATFDPLAAAPREAFMEGVTDDVVEIDGLKDIVL